MKKMKLVSIILVSVLLVCAFIWNKQLNAVTGLHLGGSSAFEENNLKYVGEWDGGKEGYLILSKDGQMKWYASSKKDEKNVMIGTWELLKKDKYGKSKNASLIFFFDSLTIDGKKKEANGQEENMEEVSYQGDSITLYNSIWGSIRAKKVK